MLTTYNNLFCDDYLLPTGNLHKNKNKAKKTDMIIITKCPKDISELAQKEIIKRIGTDKTIYFSYIDYDEKVYGMNGEISVEEIKNTAKVLLAGIANPNPFFNYLQKEKDTLAVFADHHQFTKSEIDAVDEKADGRIIVTTEKDFVRLKNHSLKSLIYYLPIQSNFVKNKEEFDKNILNYVGTSTTNS